MKFYKDNLVQHLNPAGLLFLKKPGVIRTVLGSCITVTMFSKRAGIGSACHPVLPTCRDNKVCYFAACQEKYKFVECVIPEMIRLFKRAGVAPEELEVKLFGGAEMIVKDDKKPLVIQVGYKNVEMALNKLHGFGIKITSMDTGGNRGRRLFFDTSNGNVWIKKLSSTTASLLEKNAINNQITMQQNG